RMSVAGSSRTRIGSTMESSTPPSAAAWSRKPAVMASTPCLWLPVPAGIPQEPATSWTVPNGPCDRDWPLYRSTKYKNPRSGVGDVHLDPAADLGDLLR